MSFPFNSTVPTSTSVPSQDQNTLRTNAQSIQGLIAVDHVGFNAAVNTGGRHNQVTFNALQSPSATTDPVSILYSKNDSSTHPALNYINSQANFIVNPIKVFGIFTAPGAPLSSGTLTLANQMNIASATYAGGLGSSATATITFAGTPLASGTNNTNALVIWGGSRNPTYTLTNTTLVFTIGASQTFQFMIVQA